MVARQRSLRELGSQVQAKEHGGGSVGRAVIRARGDAYARWEVAVSLCWSVRGPRFDGAQIAPSPDAQFVAVLPDSWLARDLSLVTFL